MNYNIRAVLLFVVLLLGCQGKKQSSYLHEQKILDQYLAKSFHKEISEDSCVYVLMSEYGCSGCVSKLLERFLADPKSIFIMSPRTAERYMQQIKPDAIKCQIWIDSSERINRLPLHGGNICLVAVENKNVDTIIHVDATKIESQMAFFGQNSKRTSYNLD